MCPAEAVSELGLVTVRGKEVRRVRACPTAPVRLLSCEAELDVDLQGADALFLSGYNSWTDSWERPVDARMRGLARVPRRVVDKWVLDGSGDYRFTPEDEKPGHQHGFGYGYLRYGQVVGSSVGTGSVTAVCGWTRRSPAASWLPESRWSSWASPWYGGAWTVR